MGLLPEEWLARWTHVTAIGRVDEGRIRFVSAQAALLDALLASEPDVAFDERFAAPGADFADYDVVLTTYGTLKRDIAALRKITFDYGVLDESQAIKNETSAAAKAARLVSARHRLALSGTPVENHLGELWSLFEFLKE